MVTIKEKGAKKEYYCDYCGKSFSSYGIADNHEKWDAICGGVDGPEKKARLEKRANKLKKLEELTESLSEKRYRDLNAKLKKNKDGLTGLGEAQILINEYKNEVDELDKIVADLSHEDNLGREDMHNLKEKVIANVRILNIELKTRKEAFQRERARDYESAIEIWEELGEIDEAARVRKISVEQSSVKVSQKVVHGDEVTKTEIKDSVLNKSNVGNNEGEDKFSKLKELREMFDSGFISKEEMEKIKREILG